MRRIDGNTFVLQQVSAPADIVVALLRHSSLVADAGTRVRDTRPRHQRLLQAAAY